MNTNTVLLILGIVAIIGIITLGLEFLRNKYGCHHNWVTKDTKDFYENGYYEYRKVYMRCTKCGKNKSVKL